jgi:hypothetical protein
VQIAMGEDSALHVIFTLLIRTIYSVRGGENSPNLVPLKDLIQIVAKLRHEYFSLWTGIFDEVNFS